MSNIDWNGEGLPPVGTVCEYDANSNGKEPTWRTVEIVYLSEWVIVLRCVKAPEPNLGEVGVELAKDLYSGLERLFRPLPTPEQIAAEEREKAIDDIAEIIGSLWSSEREAAEFLYKAGYRRQVAP